MREFPGLVLLLPLAVASPGFPQTTLDSSRPASTPLVSARHERVSFKLYRGYLLVVPGRMDGDLNVNLLIDTGADPTVLDDRVARKLALRSIPGKLATFNDIVSVEQATLPSLDLGPVHVESLRVLVQDLSFLEKGLGVRIDAVVGIDVLGRTSFTIDYISQQLSFGPVGQWPLSAPLSASTSFPVVQMQFYGKPLKLLVDTGASHLMLFGGRPRGFDWSAPGVGRRSENLAGHFRGQQVLLPRARLGPTYLGTVRGLLVSEQGSSTQDFGGLLCPPALGIKQIAFDFEHKVLRWKR